MNWLGTTVDVRDARGILVHEGDTIVAGFDKGILRVGNILRYLEFPQSNGRPNCYLEIQWTESNASYYPKQPTRLTIWTDRNVDPRHRNDPWGWHGFYKVVLP